MAKADSVKILPALNNISAELFRIMNDENSSFRQIHNIVRYDQAISAKIISIANSAYYNRGTRVGNLERAMIVVGFSEIKNIVMCIIYLKDILDHWKLSQEDIAALWTHSLAVANAAKILSSRTMIEDPEKAFTISILHDIGKAVFYTYGDQYRRMVEEARKGSREIHALERETFGTDHQEVGHLLSVKWRFPREFSLVIKGHHGRGENKDDLLDLIRSADAFTDNVDVDLGAKGIILQGEKERIASETKRVSELLGVIDAGR